MVPEVPAALHGDRQHHAIWPPAVAGDDLELLAATLVTAAPAEVTSNLHRRRPLRPPHTRERLRNGSLSLSAAAELQWAFDRQRRRVPPVAATATPQAATTPAVAALPTEPPLVLDAVGRQKLVEEAAGKSTRQVKRMLADLDPELAAAADRVRPLGNGRYELKAVIDAECQRGLEQLAGLLSHVDPRMTVGQLVGRLVREALDRHDPSRRRPRTGSRPADAHAHAAPTPAAEPEADRRLLRRRSRRPGRQSAPLRRHRPGRAATATPLRRRSHALRAVPFRRR